MRRALYILILITCLSTSHAATLTSATANYADVNATCVAAARNDTVLIPPGVVSWGSTLTLTKGVHLRSRDGIGTVTITRSGGVAIDIHPDSTAIANEEQIEMSGLIIDGGGSTWQIWVEGAGPTDPKPFKNLMITTNRFQNSSLASGNFSAVIAINEGQVRGVIASNEFNRCNVIMTIMGGDDYRIWENSAYYPMTFGTIDNLYFENNYIHYTTAFSGSDPGWTESGHGGRFCARYNTWDLQRATQQELWDIHGFQYWTPTGQVGTMMSEYYGNTILNCNGYRAIHHRGGKGLYFNNIISGTSGGMDVHVSAYQNSCDSDVPGTFATEVFETYFWNLLYNGVSPDVTINLNFCGIAENSNFFSQNAGNVTRGTGPPSGGSPTQGDAYWQDSTSTPTANVAITQAGVLWRFTGGVWVQYYTPFTYPHPLLGASATPGTLALGASTYSIAENGGSLQVTVTRTGGSSGAVGINYATANGTATAGSDYTTTSGTLSWANGDTATKTISIPILDDAIVEASETFNLSLSGPTGGSTLGSPNSATITITDNDTLPPAISVSPSTAQTFTDTDVNQSRTLTFTVSNTGGGTLSGSVTGLSAPFSIVSGSPYSIGGGGNQVVTIRFSPTAVGAFSQTAAFSGGAGASRGLTGTGLAVNSTVLSGVAAAGPVSFNP